MAKKNISGKKVQKNGKNDIKVSNNGSNNKIINNEPSKNKNVVEVNQISDFDEKKNISAKRIVVKIWNVVFWVLFVSLAFVWIMDFSRVKIDKKPLFCVSKDRVEFKDGTVDKCVGLGYKVYHYHRASLNKNFQFGSLVMKMKEPNK